MAKLLTFLVCEKVVISNEDNLASIISLTQGYTLEGQIDPGQKILLPVVWSVFVLWDQGKDANEPAFAQLIELLSPDKEVLLSQPMAVEFTPKKRFHRMVFRQQGFPMAGFGEYTVRLSIQDGDTTKELATYPFPVKEKSDDDASV